MRATLLLTTTALTLLAASPSQAGWQLDHYETDGANTAPNFVYGSQGPWPNPGITHNDVTYGTVWSSDSLIGNGGTVAAQGKVTAVFKWNDLNNPFPGGKVVILIKSKAEGEAKIEVPIALNPGTTLLPPAQQPPDIEDGTPGVTSRARFGSQLFTKDVAPGAIEMKQEISLSSIASTTANDGATVRVAAVAALDDRSVKITRNSKDRFELGADGSWTTYGKTCYSYHENTPTSDPGAWHNNNQLFTANLTGNWSSIGMTPRVTWNWGGGAPLEIIDTAPDTMYYANRRAPMGGLTANRYYDLSGASPVSRTKWTGTGIAPQIATLDYSALDQGDGATAKAKYVIEIHEPIELETHQSYPVWAYCPIWGSGPIAGNPNGVMQPNGPIGATAQNNPSVSVGHGTSKGLSYGLNAEFGSGEDIAGALGASVEWSQEQSRNVDASQAVNIEVGPDEFTYPLFEDKYIRHMYWFRHFTEEGEHELPSVESPPGSGYYDQPVHEWVYDEPSGSTIVWAPPQPITTGRVPAYTSTPATPTPNRSGGNS